MRLQVYMLLFAGLAMLALPGLARAQGTTEEFEKVPEDVMQGQTAAAKPKINNLPFNLYGLSGLMVTTATRSLQPGSFEVGLGGSWEESYKPHYYKKMGEFLGGVGIPGGLEFGFRVPYVMTDLKTQAYFNDFGELKRRYSSNPVQGIGSVEGMFKWGFLQQHSFLPAFAMGLGGMAPGSNYAQGGSAVKYYGVKVLLAMGLELNDLAFTDYAFAILADGVAVLRDVGVEDRAYEEKSGLVHGGMIFPLHPRNFLELILEYEGELMKGTTNQQNINSVLGSLRFVTHHFNVTAGAKYAFKDDKDYGDTLSYLATFSYTYF